MSEETSRRQFVTAEASMADIGATAGCAGGDE